MVTRADVERAAERIRGQVVHTPLVLSRKLGDLCGCQALFKLENFQMTGSFKERGALNKLLSLSPAERQRGVVTASSGNHAQGLAYHAQRLGIHARIVMPESTPLVKLTATQRWGAEVILYGDSYDEAFARAEEIARQEERVLVHPFNDPAVIAGQGTVALEILAHELSAGLDAILCPVGGGGLLAGVAVCVKEMRPEVRVIGVEAAAFPALSRSLAAGSIVAVENASSFADGIAVKKPGDLTFALAQKYVDQVVTVAEDEIANAVLLHLEREKVVVEGAGAVPLAAMASRRLGLEDKRVACIVTGGNIDVNVLNKIITRGLAVEGRILHLRIRVRDAPGVLAGALEIIKRLRANILEISHHRYDFAAPFGFVDVSIIAETRGVEHIREIQSALREAGYLARGQVQSA